MKKTVSILLLAALLMGFAVLMPMPEAKAMSVTNEKLYVEEDPAAGLYGRLCLVFAGDSKYTLYLPGSADAEKLCFSWSDSTTVKDKDGTLLTSGSAPIALPGSTAEYVVNNVRYRITTVQGSKDVRAMFLQVDTSIAGYSTFAAMNNDKKKETSAAGVMTFGNENDYYFSIKGRGNATWGRAKNPYNITLYADAACTDKKGFELIDGVKAKKWSLLANYFDDSLLRNRLGFDMASQMGIGLESEFVDLYTDGEYLGLYLLTPKADYDAPKNGYMLEIDNYLDEEDHQFTLDGMYEYHPTMEGCQNRITVKDNKANASYEDIEAYMQAAWKTLLDEDSDDYLAYIDLDSWAKYYLLHEFYKSFDVVCGSIFMYREGTTDADKLIAGPVWDLDNSMGRVQNNADLGLSAKSQHSPVGWYIRKIRDKEAYSGGDVVTHFWLQQLGRHESFMARVEEIYDQYQHVFDNAATCVDGWTAQMGDSARMNFHLPQNSSGRPAIKNGITYACSSHGCVVTNGWEDFAANLRTFAEKRAQFLEKNMPAPPTEPPVTTAPTEPPVTTAPTEPTTTTAPTQPTEENTTAAPTDAPVPPTSGNATIPPFSQVPAVGTEGNPKPTEPTAPPAEVSPRNLWYILVPAGVLALALLIALLCKRKKKEE